MQPALAGPEAVTALGGGRSSSSLEAAASPSRRGIRGTHAGVARNGLSVGSANFRDRWLWPTSSRRLPHTCLVPARVVVAYRQK